VQAVNTLILSLVTSQRKTTVTEIDAIIAHVATAPFATYLARVPKDLQLLLAEKGVQVPTKLPSVEWHLLKRIYDDRQWPEGVTIQEYVADLQRAILHPQVGVWTYQYFQRPYASFLAPSHVTDAPLPLPYIFVVYDPYFGTITTGYQASGYGTVFDSNCSRIVRHR
jgi:hypothetical protein